MHVPPSREAVGDAMPALFDLLREEAEPCVRVVLGHFIFVYIHPYMDGNGRMGRFLMNVMLAGGGYPWTVVPLEKRAPYMAALEEASVNQNIGAFTDFLDQRVNEGLDGKSIAEIPSSNYKKYTYTGIILMTSAMEPLHPTDKNEQLAGKVTLFHPSPHCQTASPNQLI